MKCMHGFSRLYMIAVFVSVATPKHGQRDRGIRIEGQGRRERAIGTGIGAETGGQGQGQKQRNKDRRTGRDGGKEP